MAPPPVDTVIDVLMRTDLSPEAIAAALGRSGLLGAGPGMPAPAGELYCCSVVNPTQTLSSTNLNAAEMDTRMLSVIPSCHCAVQVRLELRMSISSVIMVVIERQLDMFCHRCMGWSEEEPASRWTNAYARCKTSFALDMHCQA